MRVPLFLIIIFFIFNNCAKQDKTIPPSRQPAIEDIVSAGPHTRGRGALLLTDFTSLEDFKSVIDITYIDHHSASASVKTNKPTVFLHYKVDETEINSILESGISEGDFWKANSGGIFKKIGLAFRTPFAVANKKYLRCIERLGRRRPWEFGKGDVAFYDMAEMMVEHISDEDTMSMTPAELDEKGYLNTFNHITAQAFMTSIFSEEIADFVADVHERHTMPELITGDFTEAQLADFEKGPVDNYVDILNNEWGQELGKVLRVKYKLNRKTFWTPALLASFLNDIQSYNSYVFKIGFRPFRPADEKVMRFANKINTVLE